MGSTLPPFTIKDEPIENLRPLKVRVIGAGYSGIYLGIRIPQRLRNVDLQIYEKNEGVGGAWWENRYPGISTLFPVQRAAIEMCKAVPVIFQLIATNTPSTRTPTGQISMRPQRRYGSTLEVLQRSMG